MLQNVRNIRTIKQILIISFIMVSIAIVSNSNASDISVNSRASGNVDLLTGTKVTDMPYGYYVPDFGKSSIKGYDKIDLSSNSNKKLLIGYGTYDIKDENCRYLDAPQNSSFDIDFEKRYTEENTTYGVSRLKMNYSDCLALTSRYSGYIYTPKSATDMKALEKKFSSVNKDMWLGYSRVDCNSTYKNNENYRQSYENFSTTDLVCDMNRRFTYKPANTFVWEKTNTSMLNYCPIKINSKDYLRPIKYCLPWWRVERKWKLEENSDLVEINGKTYDMEYAKYIIDYPKEATICTNSQTSNTVTGVFKTTLKKIDTNSFNQNIITVNAACTVASGQDISTNDYNSKFRVNCVEETASTQYSYFKNTMNCITQETDGTIGRAKCKQVVKEYRSTCQEYYDINKSPICIDNIGLEVCKVNQCSGYFEDTCKRIETIIPGKTYDYGIIMIDNVSTRVKTKVDKQTHVYNCPPPKSSLDTCSEKNTVVIFSEECPSSKCSELAACIEGDSLTSAECLAAFPCERNYGSTDNIKRDSNGKATHLVGYCKDGTEINASIEIKSSESRTCREFSSVSTQENYNKQCISSASKSESTISGSITKPDVYKDDERCLRINNIEESRPPVSTVFDYTTKGFFKTVIQKAYVDDTVDESEATVDISYVNTVISGQKVEKTNTISGSVSFDDTQAKADEQYCNATFSTNWIKKRYEKPLELTEVKAVLKSRSTDPIKYCKVSSATINGEVCQEDSYVLYDYKPLETTTTPASKSTSCASGYSYIGRVGDMSNHLEGVFGSSYGYVITYNVPEPQAGYLTENRNGVTLNYCFKEVQYESHMVIYLGSAPKVSYSCPSGYSLSGSTCTKSVPPSGYTAYGSSARKVTNSNACTSGLSYNSTTRKCEASVLYNYPILIVGDSTSTCNALISSIGGAKNINSNTEYTSYDFASANITSSDLTSKTYCMIGASDIVPGDEVFNSIVRSGNNLAYKSKASVNKEQCEKYSKCFPSRVTTSYSNETQTKVCALTTDDEENTSIEAVGITVPAHSPNVINIPNDINGSYVSTINGYSDVFSVQEYTEGSFGYISNFNFKTPKNNIVKVNGKEISPIVQHEAVQYNLKYDYRMLNHTQKTRNEKPSEIQPEYTSVSFFLNNVGGDPFSNPLVDTIAQVLIAPYALLFGERLNWGWLDSYHKLYLTPTIKHVENYYGYDTRTLKNGKLILDERKVITGTLKKKTYLSVGQRTIDEKTENFENMGFPSSVVSTILTSNVEKNFASMGFPGREKYWWGSEKVYYTTNREKTASQTAVALTKEVNTVFMGAVNSMSIIVPYLGSYELKAFDKNDNVIGSIIVEEEDFVRNVRSSTGNVSQAFAKIYFALSDKFNIAENLDSNLSTGGCLTSEFVEWGGGVSGAYFEQTDPVGLECSKSNDVYVEAHSATRIELRATNSKVWFKIPLKAPMPYPNRIRLVNMMNLEEKKYECWTDTVECTELTNIEE